MDSLSSVTADILKAFLTNEQGDTFCVPWVHAQRGIEALGEAGFAFSRVTVNARAFTFDVASISFRDAEGKSRLDEALKCVYGDVNRDALHGSYCMAGVQVFPLVLPKMVDVFVHDTMEPYRDPKVKRQDDLAVTEYKRVMEFLARISGYSVNFHADAAGMRQPWPEEPNVLRILTNCCPPGQTGLRYAISVHGLTIHEKGHEVLANGPTPGRGIILKDADGESTVQMLGNTWYILFPTMTHFNTRTSAQIFAKVIGEAWTASQAEKPAPQTVTEEAFVTSFTTWVEAMPKIFEDGVRKTDEKIAQLQRDLAAAIREKTECARYASLMRGSSFMRKTKKRAKADWTQLMQASHLSGATFDSDGINFTTAPITIVHDGHAYDLGAFVVRLSSRGVVSVWHEAPMHKDGIAHPHISGMGHPCFGNAGTAIAQATGELRFADAIRYVVRWLREGYTPALADKKIEEWPRVGESQSEYFTRFHVHVRPKKSAATKAALELLAEEMAKDGKPMNENVKAMMADVLEDVELATEPAVGVKEQADATS